MFPGIANSPGDDTGYVNAGILKLGAFTAWTLGWFAPMLASYNMYILITMNKTPVFESLPVRPDSTTSIPTF